MLAQCQPSPEKLPAGDRLLQGPTRPKAKTLQVWVTRLTDRGKHWPRPLWLREHLLRGVRKGQEPGAQHLLQVSCRHGGTAAPVKSQHNGCLCKACIMTTAGDKSMQMGTFHKAPPQIKNYEQSTAAERENQSFLEMRPQDIQSQTFSPNKHRQL